MPSPTASPVTIQTRRTGQTVLTRLQGLFPTSPTTGSHPPPVIPEPTTSPRRSSLPRSLKVRIVTWNMQFSVPQVPKILGSNSLIDPSDFREIWKSSWEKCLRTRPPMYPVDRFLNYRSTMITHTIWSSCTPSFGKSYLHADTNSQVLARNVLQCQVCIPYTELLPLTRYCRHSHGSGCRLQAHRQRKR
jgi:hypothetical protein